MHFWTKDWIISDDFYDEWKVTLCFPQFNLHLSPLMASLRLSCGGHSAEGEVHYAWYKGNRPVEDVELLAGRLEVRQEAGQSHLVISQLHPHDGGVYVCLLSN